MAASCVALHLGGLSLTAEVEYSSFASDTSKNLIYSILPLTNPWQEAEYSFFPFTDPWQEVEY
jgi:hypothetical protein